MQFIIPEIIRVIGKQQMLRKVVAYIITVSVFSLEEKSRPVSEFKNKIRMGFLTAKSERMLPSSHREKNPTKPTNNKNPNTLRHKKPG